MHKPIRLAIITARHLKTSSGSNNTVVNLLNNLDASKYEKLLMKQFGSTQRDVWGGGYNLQSHQFETNAIINLRARTNTSLEILDPNIRKTFLNVVKNKLKNIGRSK